MTDDTGGEGPGMRGAEQGSAREEAERLVAMAWAAAQTALSTGPADRFATGSAECCVCPVCRLVATIREPDPGVVERLAAGAGDIAAGVANLLRAFAGPESPGPAPGGPDASAEAAPGGSAPHEASSGASPPGGPGDRGTEHGDVWAAATRDRPPDDDGASACGDAEGTRRTEGSGSGDADHRS